MCTTANTTGNGIRGPLNALFFTVFDGYLNWLLAERKSRLFAALPETVVELGAGVGANFRYLRKGAAVTAVEPNPHMHSGLRKKAGEYGVDLRIMDSGAESIALPDNSVDAVICTLVLCTVEDPVRVLQEVRRILKPGGRFMFLEHVAAPPGNWRRGLQDLLHRPWRYVFEGCNTNRETRGLIEAARFRDIEIDEYKMGGPFVPVNTQIAGVAVV